MPVTDFEVLFRDHYKWLCIKAFEVCADWQVAEDLVQDFFEAYWHKMKQGEKVMSFPPYAAVAVRNRAVTYLRTQKLHHKKNWQLAEESAVTEEMFTPEDDRQQKMLRLLEQLPAQRRHIFLLHQLDNLKYAQIAEKTGLSVNTIKTHLKLAYRQLREALRLLILIFFAGN